MYSVMGNIFLVEEIKLGDKIGEGLYGEVFKVVWCRKNVVVKWICLVFFESDYDGYIRVVFLEKYKLEWELFKGFNYFNIV